MNPVNVQVVSGVRSTDKKTGQPIMYDLEEKINSAVFPGLQGGPHNHAIAGIAVAMGHAQTEEFKAYQKQVRSQTISGLVAKGLF